MAGTGWVGVWWEGLVDEIFGNSLKSGDFAGNFGKFLGVMFVFEPILTIWFNETRKLAKKGGKKGGKIDEKVQKNSFSTKKNKNVRFLDKIENRTCAFR